MVECYYNSQAMAFDIEIQTCSNSFPTNCQLIDFPQYKDARGCLCVAENGQKNIPMEIDRVFWISNVPENSNRGEHAHRTCSEIIVPVCGSFEVELTDGIRKVSIRMDNPAQGLLIGPMVWCRLFHFSANAVCLCLASGKYDSEGYINHFEDFIKEIKKCR